MNYAINQLELLKEDTIISNYGSFDIKLRNTLDDNVSNEIYLPIILKNAIKAGGTTIKAHMQPDGCLGDFNQKLRVYGRSGYKCIMCKATIKEIKQSGRTSFYCGVCQR